MLQNALPRLEDGHNQHTGRMPTSLDHILEVEHGITFDGQSTNNIKMADPPRKEWRVP